MEYTLAVNAITRKDDLIPVAHELGLYGFKVIRSGLVEKPNYKDMGWIDVESRLGPTAVINTLENSPTLSDRVWMALHPTKLR
jgi:hypothetical protein